jgi:hypothetical protein
MSTATPHESPRIAPPVDQMPGVLAVRSVIGHSGDSVVALTEIHTYPTGCLLHFVAAARRPDPPTPPWGHSDQGLHIFVRGAGRDDERVRFAVEYPDGTTLMNLANAPAEPTGDAVFVSFEGRGRSDHQGSRLVYRQPVWLSPLPTVGKLRVIAQWPAYGITDATLELDCAELAQSARDAHLFW